MDTVDQLLSAATHRLFLNSESARLDAEILLAHVLKRSRTWLRTWPDCNITRTKITTFNQLVAQRQNGIPVAYIVGQRDFWLHSFHVTPDVLIPRPETELLVEQCLRIISQHKYHKMLELGTGSGAISISIGAEKPDIEITATDISPAALAIASKNATHAAVSNIHFIQSDWFLDIPKQPYHLIISNPPYVEQDDEHLTQGDVRFEPRLALTSGRDGLRDIRIITHQARQYLGSNSYLALEHGYNQANAVKRLLSTNQFFNIKHYNDLQNHPRTTIAQYNSD